MAGRKHEAFLGLGANIGNPRDQISRALTFLDQHPSNAVADVSSLYRTAPWGKTDQPDFLNICIRLETDLHPEELLDLGQDIERKLKRVRAEKWGPRSIDIDILSHSMGPWTSARLELPHPRMAERDFVVVPLGEIAPDFLISGKPVRHIASRFENSKIEAVAPQGWWRK